MGYIIYNNVLDITASNSVTVSSGSIVNHTSPDKMMTRALADKYVYTKTGMGTLKITITLASDVTKNSLTILGRGQDSLTLQSIKLYNGVTDQGLTTPDPITKSRYVDDVLISDTHYIFNNYYTFDKIEILFSDVSGGSGFFQKIYCGTAFEINFNVLSTTYSPSDTSNKDRSNGGQVYTSNGIMYNNIKTSSTALTHSEAWGAGSLSVNDINLLSGSDQPIILIPSESQNISVYGTQKQLAILTPIEKKDTSDWFWKASFNIEEEL